MITDLEVFERAANLFPGFENEIQGLYREKAGTSSVRFFTSGVREG
jgi:ornithine decarboxylase